MRRSTVMWIGLVALLSLGCRSTFTGQSGISYGMTKDEVLERARRSDTIVSTNGAALVTEGTVGPKRQPARKTFIFRDGKLTEVIYTLL